MAAEPELWVTRFFNDYLAAPAKAVLDAVGVHPHNPERPWINFVSMEILVALVIVVVFALLRSRLSVDKPGKIQQSFELIYQFLRGQITQIAGTPGLSYLAFCGTLFIFILFSNLIGLVPSLEAPTMFPRVPAGCAMASFLVYNALAVKEQGAFGYLKHLWGPVWWLGPLFLPIEVVSHLARPMSLTIRLYANMLAGEKVTLVFLGLAPLFVPTIFMGLHTFVSVVQAFIFTVLTMIYIGGAIAHTHEEHH
jgi:F-type H+-transporting ATPase subunit a